MNEIKPRQNITGAALAQFDRHPFNQFNSNVLFNSNRSFVFNTLWLLQAGIASLEVYFTLS